MEIQGKIKRGKRTKELAKRLKPADIAVIDHEDIDSVAAQMLVEAGVKTVINAAKSISGKYPNLGPRVLIDGGITLVDNCGQALFEDAADGDEIVIDGDGNIACGGKDMCAGAILTRDSADAMLEDAKKNLDNELDKFVRNTVEYVSKERSILLDPANLPDVGKIFRDKPALIVVRGEGYKKDLSAVRTYIKDEKPILIGVDGGADAILEKGFKPHFVIGDMDSVSDKALLCGAKVIVHAYVNGKAPGLPRVKELGIDPMVCAIPGTSEDLAMLLAYEKGAKLIVTVGSHSNMIDFLDKGRKGMSSTFLTRLKIGNKLVDAKGVRHLYRVAPGSKHLASIVLAALVVLFTVIALSPNMRDSIQNVMFDMKSKFWKVWLNLRMWEK